MKKDEGRKSKQETNTPFSAVCLKWIRNLLPAQKAKTTLGHHATSGLQWFRQIKSDNAVFQRAIFCFLLALRKAIFNEVKYSFETGRRRLKQTTSLRVFFFVLKNARLLIFIFVLSCLFAFFPFIFVSTLYFAFHKIHVGWDPLLIEPTEGVGYWIPNRQGHIGTNHTFKKNCCTSSDHSLLNHWQVNRAASRFKTQHNSKNSQPSTTTPIFQYLHFIYLQLTDPSATRRTSST